MPEAVVISEFLATLGYNVDEASQRRFVDSLESIGKTIAGLGLGLTGLAGTIMGVVSSMAGSASQMSYLSQNLGESVTNVERAIYMWQRLGVAPAETMKALQGIQQMRLSDPAKFQLFSTEQFGGQGTPAQQEEHFLERYRQASEQVRFQMRQLFGEYIPQQILLAAATRGDQAAAGGNEFNFVNRLFHFDPDRFGTESNAFEQAWMSFHLRLNTWFKANVAEPLTVLETQGLTALSGWIDRNGPDLTKRLEEIGKSIRSAFMLGLDTAKDLITWFEKLPPSAKQAAEGLVEAFAIAAVALRTNPVFLTIAAISFALEKLIKDYEAWKQAGSHGPSPLGIDYGKVGKDIEYVLTKVNDVAKAFGGWQAVLIDVAVVFGGARFLGLILGGLASIQTAAVATGTAIAGEIGGGIAAATLGLTTLIGLTVALKGDEHLTDEQKKQRDSRTDQEAKKYFAEHPDWAKAHPDDAARLNRIPSTDTSAQGGPAPTTSTSGSSSVWDKLLNVLSYINPISAAKADELPDNLKQLNSSVGDLNDALENWLQPNALGGPGQGGGLFGGGGGIPGSTGSGGGGGGPVNWKDPNVMKAVATFTSMGYSMDETIGIVTNLWAESGLKTGAVNLTGHAGIAQWDRTRQLEFSMLNNGKRIQDATLEEQLQFINYELHHREQAALARLRNAHGVQQTIRAVGEGFERYGSEAETLRRIRSAGVGPNPMWYQNAVSNVNNGRSSNVTQTNNVTVNATGGGPNDYIAAWDQQLLRQHTDLQRRSQASYQ